jgi:pentatricopeptide repeat protein
MVMKEILGAGLQPDRFTWGALLDSYANARDISGCDQVLAQMKSNGVDLDEITVATYLTCLGTLREPVLAESFLESTHVQPLGGNRPVLIALARAYALAWKKPERIERFLHIVPKDASAAMWTAIALHRSGDSEEALKVLDSCPTPNISTLSVRCSIAAKVGDRAFDRSLLQFFDTLAPSERELKDAYLRFCISRLMMTDGNHSIEVQTRIESLYERQLTARGRGQPILRDLIRANGKPWFAIICAFADRFSVISCTELLLLISDDDEREYAKQQLEYSRGWNRINSD